MATQQMVPATLSIKEAEDNLYGSVRAPASLPNRPEAQAPTVLVCNPTDPDRFTVGGDQKAASANNALVRYFASVASRIKFPITAAQPSDSANDEEQQVGTCSPQSPLSPLSTSNTQPGGVTAGATGITDTSNDISLVAVITRVPDIHSNEEGGGGDPWERPWEVDVFDTVTLDNNTCHGTTGYRLMLFSKGIYRVSGLTLGQMIGVVGNVIRRDVESRPTCVAAREILFPTPATPLGWGPKHVNMAALKPADTKDRSNTLRVHFACGPYTWAGSKQSIEKNLISLVLRSAGRNADTLVLCGPFVPELTATSVSAPTTTAQQELIEKFERNHGGGGGGGSTSSVGQEASLMSCVQSYDGMLLSLVEGIQEAMTVKQVTTRVVLVPSMNDATQMPVLPQPPLDVTTYNPNVLLASNPSEINIVLPSLGAAAPLKIGVSSFDALSHTYDSYVERGYGVEGRLRRVCDACFCSGLYVPVTDRPSPVHDMRWIPNVACGASLYPDAEVEDYMNVKDGAVASSSSNDNSSAAGVGGRAAFDPSRLVSKGADLLDDAASPEAVKKSCDLYTPAPPTHRQVPHIIFSPSTKPAYAGALLQDESGPLFINSQMPRNSLTTAMAPGAGATSPTITTASAASPAGQHQGSSTFGAMSQTPQPAMAKIHLTELTIFDSALFLARGPAVCAAAKGLTVQQLYLSPLGEKK